MMNTDLLPKDAPMNTDFNIPDYAFQNRNADQLSNNDNNSQRLNYKSSDNTKNKKK